MSGCTTPAPATVVGRLLITGALGGALAGLLAGSSLVLADESWRTWWAGALFLGAGLGLVAGPLAQAVTAVAVLRARTAGSGVRFAAVCVPSLLALLLSLAVASSLTLDRREQVALVLTSVMTTAVLAAATRGWCLAPLVVVRPAGGTAARSGVLGQDGPW